MIILEVFLYFCTAKCYHSIIVPLRLQSSYPFEFSLTFIIHSVMGILNGADPDSAGCVEPKECLVKLLTNVGWIMDGVFLEN